MALACRDTNILNHTIFDQFHHVQAGQLLNLPSHLPWQEMPKRYVSGKVGRLTRDLVRLEASQRLLNKALDEWESTDDSENGGFW